MNKLSFVSKYNVLQNVKFICSVAILVNFLASYLRLLYRQPFNVDGIIYLNAAKAFLADGIKSAILVYHWPFYSLLIACVSKLTHLPVENAAFLLDAFLIAILVVAFILLVKELGGSVAEQYFALLIILIFPYLNHDRDNILRDFGYYAFLLTSLLFFMRYMRQLDWRNAISWSISIVVAALFRIEGVIILALAPLIIFVKPNLSFAQKRIGYLKANTLFIIVITVITTLLLIKHRHIAGLGHIGELIGKLYTYFFNWANYFIIKKSAVAQYVLNPIAAGSALTFLLGGLTAIFLESFFGVLGFFYTVLVFYALFKKQIPKNINSQLALYTYSIIILLTLFVFLVQQYFLSRRYVAPLCLIFMLSIPFGLRIIFSNGLQWWKQTQISKRWVAAITCLLLLVTTVDGFGHFGPSKTYMINAGVWIKQNTPPQDRLYSNSAQVAYYSDRPGTRYPDDFGDVSSFPERLKKLNLNNYDYLALLIDHNKALEEQQIITTLKQQPINTFHNKRGDKILIFKVQH